MTFKGFTARGSKLGVSSSAGIAIELTNSEHAVAYQPKSLELRIATSMEKTHEKQPQQYQECDRVPLSEISNCWSLKGEKATSDMETRDLKIPKDLLKRIDPSLWPKKAGKDDEDEGESSAEEHGNRMEVYGFSLPEKDDPIDADMQMEQRGDVSLIPC